MVEAVHHLLIHQLHQRIHLHLLNILQHHRNIHQVHRFTSLQAVKVVIHHHFHQHHLNTHQLLQPIHHLNHHHVTGLFIFSSLVNTSSLIVYFLLVQHLPFIAQILDHHVIAQHHHNILLNLLLHQQYPHQSHLHALMMMTTI